MLTKNKLSPTMSEEGDAVPDEAARLSWQLVKIAKDLSLEDQRKLIDYAKSLITSKTAKS